MPPNRQRTSTSTSHFHDVPTPKTAARSGHGTGHRSVVSTQILPQKDNRHTGELHLFAAMRWDSCMAGWLIGKALGGSPARHRPGADPRRRIGRKDCRGRLAGQREGGWLDRFNSAEPLILCRISEARSVRSPIHRMGRGRRGALPPAEAASQRRGTTPRLDPASLSASQPSRRYRSRIRRLRPGSRLILLVARDGPLPRMPIAIKEQAMTDNLRGRIDRWAVAGAAEARCPQVPHETSPVKRQRNARCQGILFIPGAP